MNEVVALIVFVALAQAKPSIDPRIAREWTLAVGQGLESATLKIDKNRSFSLRSRATGSKETVITGFVVVSRPSNEVVAIGKMAQSLEVKFLYDLPSLRKVGMTAESITALKKKGKTYELGMQLYFVPEVPLLTDILTAHFVPSDDKENATNRLRKWKPI